MKALKIAGLGLLAFIQFGPIVGFVIGAVGMLAWWLQGWSSGIGSAVFFIGLGVLVTSAVLRGAST